MMQHWIESGITYDLLLFLHDKKSPQYEDDRGKINREQLLKACLSKSTLRKVFNGFKFNHEIGMISSKDKIRCGKLSQSYIFSNKENYYLLEDNIDLFNLKLEDKMGFVAGTMFWVRADIFKQWIHSIDLNDIYNKLETGNVSEPSLTHAIERIFGMVITQNGFKFGNI